MKREAESVRLNRAKKADHAREWRRSRQKVEAIKQRNEKLVEETREQRPSSDSGVSRNERWIERWLQMGCCMTTMERETG